MNKIDINRPPDATPEELEMIDLLEENAKKQLDKDLDEIMRDLWP